MATFFPAPAISNGVATGYAERLQSRNYRSLDEVLADFDRLSRPWPGESGVCDFGDDLIESAYLFPDRQVAQSLARAVNLDAVCRIARQLAAGDMHFRSAVEKALFQRDLFQCYLICLNAGEVLDGGEEKDRMFKTSKELAGLIGRTLLSLDEYAQLQAAHPLTVEPPFITRFEPKLAGGYLPLRAIAEDADWVELLSDEKASAHFNRYQGRSFIKTYIKVPGFTKGEVLRYWDDVSRRFGPLSTVNSAVPDLPAGAETLLVRTFGVFLDDRTYVDSRILEEVLIRVFRFPQQTLDSDASDYRGTYQYQYKMRRRLLLAGPTAFGLHRMHDDDGSFWGFFGDVPDRMGATSPMLATVRLNCIHCHSLQLYGSRSVFSIGRERPVSSRTTASQAGSLRVLDDAPGDGSIRFRLLTKEARALEDDLK